MKTKIGVIFLVMIMALAGVGASYAAWTKSVDIDASVTTGNLDFRIHDIVINDNGGAQITRAYVNDYEWTVTIANAFPGWEGFITVTHKNAGTVPIKFDSFQVVDLTGEWTLKNAYTLKFWTGDWPTPGTANVEGTLQAFTTQQYYGTTYVPIAVGATHDSLVSLKLDPDLTGFENKAVTFTFRHWATQDS